MIKKPIRHGNRNTAVIEKTMPERSHISIETPLELTTDGKKIMLSPRTEVTQEVNILEFLERIHQKYNKTFKKLGE